MSRLSRRTFFGAVLGVSMIPNRVTAARGFRVSGVVTTTEEDDHFQIGHEFGLTAAPGTEPHRLIALMAVEVMRVTVHVEPV